MTKHIITAIICAVFIQFSFSQTTINRTAGVTYTNGVPTADPGARGSLIAVDVTTWREYEWNAGSSTWVHRGFFIQEISGCTAPAFTPGLHDSYYQKSIGCKSLWIWNGTSWDLSGDDWGGQVVDVLPPLTGEGTGTSPLTIGQAGATTGQVLKWNGSAWVPAEAIDFPLLAPNGTQKEPSFSFYENEEVGLFNDGGLSLVGVSDGVNVLTSNSDYPGSINIFSGGGDIGGSILLTSGEGLLNGGDIAINCGTGVEQGGKLYIGAGYSTISSGGEVSLFAGGSELSTGGRLILRGGSAVNGRGGNLELYGGVSVDGIGGDFTMSGGDSQGGRGGRFSITGGQSIDNDGGAVSIYGGSTDAGVGGRVELSGGIGNGGIASQVDIANCLLNVGAVNILQRDALVGKRAGSTIFTIDAVANDGSVGVLQVWNGTGWKNCW